MQRFECVRRGLAALVLCCATASRAPRRDGSRALLQLVRKLIQINWTPSDYGQHSMGRGAARACQPVLSPGG